jgi:hypothetical protein
VVEAEVGMGGDARGAAAAAIGVREETESDAIICTDRRHRELLRFRFDLILRIGLPEKERAGLKTGPYNCY